MCIKKESESTILLLYRISNLLGKVVISKESKTTPSALWIRHNSKVLIQPEDYPHALLRVEANPYASSIPTPRSNFALLLLSPSRESGGGREGEVTQMISTCRQGRSSYYGNQNLFGHGTPRQHSSQSSPRKVASSRAPGISSHIFVFLLHEVSMCCRQRLGVYNAVYSYGIHIPSL